MPRRKLTNRQLAELTLRAQTEPVDLLARTYNVSERYVRQLSPQRPEYVVYKLPAKTPLVGQKLNSITIMDPVAYEIGKYKNGNSIFAYAGEAQLPFVTLAQPELKLIGYDPAGKPIRAYIGKTAQAIREKVIEQSDSIPPTNEDLESLI